MNKTARNQTVPFVVFPNAIGLKNQIVQHLPIAESKKRNDSGDDNNEDGDVHGLICERI